MPKPTKVEKLTDAQLTEISELISEGYDREHIATVLNMRMQTLNAVLAASVFDPESPIGEAIFKRRLSDSVLSMAYESFSKIEETRKERWTVVGTLSKNEAVYLKKQGEEGAHILEHVKAGGVLLKVEITQTWSPADTRLLIKLIDKFVSKQAETRMQQPVLTSAAEIDPELDALI